MNKSPMVSIITVCYNSAKTIEDTLRSVAEQEYPLIEYIVVDGGSTDGTLDIIAKYRDKIALLISEPDNGIYDAMNKGISHSTGDIVGLLNADDVYVNTRVISTIIDAFEANNIDSCYGDLIYFPPDNPNKIHRYWQSCDFVPGAFAKGWTPAHPTFFVKRNIYSLYGMFDLSYYMGNDVELMMRFLEKYRIKSYYIPQILVKMRLGGMSNRHFKSIWLQNKNILSAAKRLNLPISTSKFVLYKLLNRLSQFIRKPERGSSYAK